MKSPPELFVSRTNQRGVVQAREGLVRVDRRVVHLGDPEDLHETMSATLSVADSRAGTSRVMLRVSFQQRSRTELLPRRCKCAPRYLSVDLINDRGLDDGSRLADHPGSRVLCGIDMAPAGRARYRLEWRSAMPGSVRRPIPAHPSFGSLPHEITAPLEPPEASLCLPSFGSVARC